MPVVTLKDIAQEANVSVMTVSNVVNGNLSKVSKEKAAQIQEIIRRRNYVQNASARNLAKANSNIVAIMLRNIGNENALSGPHNAALVGQMIRLLQEGGFYAMVSLVENKADIAKTLRAWNVRGAVFWECLMMKSSRFMLPPRPLWCLWTATATYAGSAAWALTITGADDWRPDA